MTGTNTSFRRFYLLGGIILAGWYLVEQRSTPGPWFWIIAGFLVLDMLLIGLSETKKLRSLGEGKVSLPSSLIWMICLLLLSIPFVLTYMFGKTIFQHPLERVLFLFWISGISAWFLQSSLSTKSISAAFVISLLTGGFIYRIGLFLPEISTSIFSLGWSEGSRYFNASQFLSSQIFGRNLALPVLHPSRYLLQAIPYLFAPHQILVHRIWQVVLWIGLTGGGAYSLARRIAGSRLFVTFLSVWLFLFFFQGAVYYHLMLCAIVIFAGFDSHKPVKTLVWVIVASVWAGISRLNWMPVPALLAVTLYLLENPLKGKNLVHYLTYPVIWSVAGAAAALLSNRVYIAISGNDPAFFSSSLHSFLIWHRLLPNQTYSYGILLGLLIVVLPLGLLVLQKFLGKELHKKIHWIRLLGLGCILSVFLLGGILVSVKIGGGGDLHNLDAFLVFYACISLYFVRDQIQLENSLTYSGKQVSPVLVLLTVVVPVVLLVSSEVIHKTIDSRTEQTEIAILQKVVDTANQQPGKPLFISETQLLAFQNLHNVDPIPEYEKVFLMEMVMSQNTSVLDPFQEKMKRQEFSMIVTDSTWILVEDIRSSFGIEGRLWIDKVVEPMLQYYEPLLSMENGSIRVLVPIGQRERFLKALDGIDEDYLVSNWYD